MPAQHRSYFGSINADNETKNILADHVKFDFEDRLKCGNRETGSQIIVGTTGSGKTALRKFVEQSDNESIVWNIDVTHSYFDLDVTSISGRSGIIQNTIAFILLEALLQELRTNASEFGIMSGKKAALTRLSGKIGELIGNIPNAVSFEAPVKINFGELFKSGAKPYVQNALEELQGKTLSILEDRRVYIMIDDAEDVFPGLEGNPKFIEGLARAVQRINVNTNERLHALLFLKYGVFRNWYENQTEFKKVEEDLEHITWNHTALRKLVARRISRIHDKDRSQLSDAEIEELWGKEFDWGKDKGFEEFAKEFTQYCVNGPRDMLDVCNRSKVMADEANITFDHLQNALPEYSESKLFGIIADFGDVYSGLSRFIESVFQGCVTQMSGIEFADWIEKRAFLDKHLDDFYQQYDWYSSASKETLTTLMYKVGLLGRRVSPDKVEYSMERPSRTFGELAESQLVIHPAYRACLYVESPPIHKGMKA